MARRWLAVLTMSAMLSHCVKKSEVPERAPHEPRHPKDRGLSPQVGDEGKPNPTPLVSPTPTPTPAPAPGPTQPIDRSAEDLAKFKLAFTNRAWKLCYSQDVSSLLVESYFKDDMSWSASSNAFESLNCKGKVSSTEMEAGTYELLPSQKPGSFPLNLHSTKGRVGTTYELVGLKGDTLHFGKFDESNDGSQAEKRPVELNDYGYGSGSLTPIMTN